MSEEETEKLASDLVDISPEGNRIIMNDLFRLWGEFLLSMKYVLSCRKCVVR